NLPAASPVLKKWNAKVLALLRSPRETERWTGLCLLGPTARQACAEVFDNNCIQWMSCLLDMYKKQPSERTQAHLAALFLEVLAVGVKKPDLRRALSDSHFPRFVQLMLALTRTVSSATTKSKKGASTTASAVANKPANVAMALQALARCLELQPGPARPFSNQIFATAVSHLDSLDSRVLAAACTCIAHIPLCGKAGSTPQEQWTMLLTTTLSSMHQVLDTAYAVLDEQSAPPTVAVRGSELPLPELSAETITTTHMLAKACHRRFAALCALAKTMLGGSVLLRQSVPTGLLFDVLVRVCEVDHYTPTRYGADATYEQLMCNVVQYHEAMLSVFQTVCVSMGPQLLPFAGRICYLLNQMRKLHLTKGSTYHGCSKVLVLQCYVSAAQCLGPGMDTATTDSMVTTVFKGVKYIAVQTQSADTQAIATDNGQLFQWWMAAMATLATVLSRQTTHLTAEKLSDLGAWACLQLTAYQVHPTLAPNLLGRPECRLGTYKVLRAMALNSRPTHSSYIQQAVRVFQKGMVDPDITVSEYCHESSLICDWLIHPRLPITQRVVPGTSSNRLIGLSLMEERSIESTAVDMSYTDTATHAHTETRASLDTITVKRSEMDTSQPEGSIQPTSHTHIHATVIEKVEHEHKPQAHTRRAEDAPEQPTVKRSRVQASDEQAGAEEKTVIALVGSANSSTITETETRTPAESTSEDKGTPTGEPDLQASGPSTASAHTTGTDTLSETEVNLTRDTDTPSYTGNVALSDVGTSEHVGDNDDDGSDMDDIPDIVDEEPDSE
ncbi:hypothetical protein SARC_04467, partial [Sphaeroforma arctica JP610]